MSALKEIKVVKFNAINAFTKTDATELFLN